MAGFKSAHLVLVFIGTVLVSVGHGEPQVPCYFIFGDSLFDNGNNNDLRTEAKVNFWPYGIDFPNGPTGRFSNGRNIADIIVEHLGFEGYIPPFAKARGKQILRGVNYASGGAGIRDETGSHMGDRISFNRQLKNHKVTISRLSNLRGSKQRARKYLNTCLYTVGMGNNDFINNYFLPEKYNTKSLYTPAQYAQVLAQQYSAQLKTLYKAGARKIGIFGAGYVTCTPTEMAIFGTNSTTCAIGEAIRAIVLFNTQLMNLVDNLNTELSDAKFIFIEPATRFNGLSVIDAACCKFSTTLGKGQCLPNQVPCSNRSDYVFWDGFHPSEAAVIQSGESAYNAMSQLYDSTQVGFSRPLNFNGDQHVSTV